MRCLSYAPLDGRLYALVWTQRGEAITAAIADDPDGWEMDAADFAKARRGRPFATDPKLPVTLRLDGDVVHHFRASGKGWQTRINSILRKEVERATMREKNK